MRQVTLVLMVLLLTAPAMAALELECQDMNDGFCEIRYKNANPANLPRAFALTVTVDSGANVNDCNAGDANLVDFYIYPGSIDLNDVNNPKFGSPVAPSDDPGASGTGIGKGTIILEMGSLYQGGANAPDVNGVLCTIKVDPNGATDVNVTITPEEDTRGGIVLEDGSTSDANTTCQLSFGPVCWSYPCFPCGDSDGDCQILAADVLALINAWPPKPYAECADFDKDGQILASDVLVLINHWPPKPGCVGACACPP
jgi:hypothetical protein